MTDIEALASKSNKTFVLVCANFAMLAILFLGLGFVIFQTATIVTSLKRDLAAAEEQVAALAERIRDIEGRDILDELVKNAVHAVHEEIAKTVPGADTLEALAKVPESLEKTAEAMESIAHTVKDLDAEEIAQQVSYQMLNGLSEGFEEAAKSRKP